MKSRLGVDLDYDALSRALSQIHTILDELESGLEREGRSVGDTLPKVRALQECFAAGMDAYLSKPIDRNALDTTLARFLTEPTGQAAAMAAPFAAFRSP